jgi:hypothetical protein
MIIDGKAMARGMTALISSGMKKSPFPALVFGYSFETYASIKGEHFSGLKMLETSPKHYASNSMLSATSALRVGRAVHELVCDPGAANVVVYDGVRRGSEWHAFAAAHAPKTILSEKEFARAQDMRAAIEHNPVAADLFSKGRGEVTCIWDDDGVRCKSRVDWLLPDGGLVELKSANRVTPRTFAAACVSLCYHAQLAFYSHGLTLAQGFTPPSHTIVAIEKKPPYDVVVYRVGQDVLEAGARKVATWLETLKKCRVEGRWPGISGDGMIDLVIPDWALTEGLPDIEMEDSDGEG